jgi:hypothetical protein
MISAIDYYAKLISHFSDIRDYFNKKPEEYNLLETKGWEKNAIGLERELLGKSSQKAHACY